MLALCPAQQKADSVFAYSFQFESLGYHESKSWQDYKFTRKTWVTAALVCPAQTMSGVITAGSSGESRSAAQIPLHTHTRKHSCGC